MTRDERGKFLMGLLLPLHPLQTALLLERAFPFRLAEVAPAISEHRGWAATTLSWMTREGRQRVMSAMPPSGLGRVYSALEDSDRKRMGCPVLAEWMECAKKADSLFWKKIDLTLPGTREAWWGASILDRAVNIWEWPDEDIDWLMEILK